MRNDIAAGPFLPTAGTDAASESARETYKALRLAAVTRCLA